MNLNLGQDVSIWTKEWDQLTPESEIRMWDFYGLRQWISKFTPRSGKVIEAGCGLGRYVFYFSRMGIDIEGVDFSEDTIDLLNEWKKKYDFNAVFKKGTILKLDYEDSSLSGYISLGVVEHFIEGPQKALSEAYRVLRPGGIAIITTPNISFGILQRRIKRSFKNSIKILLGKKITKEPFYQYWYRPGRLKKFVEYSGLKVTKYKGAELLFAFYENNNYSTAKIKEGTFRYKVSDIFENSILSSFGSQSVVICLKNAETMHCFLCGKLKARESSLNSFDVPVCDDCSEYDIAKYYTKNRKIKYCAPYIIEPPIKKAEKSTCDFCKKEFLTDELFEDYGFSKNVCEDCLKIKEVNIVLSNEFVKPVWRKRINKC